MKTIFFDLGETLVTQNIEDSMVTRNALQDISKILPKHISAKRMFELYQAGYQSNDAIRSEYNVEIPIIIWMRRLLEGLLQQEPPDQLVSECVKIVANRRAANAVPFDDAQPALEQLSKRRVKLGLISNVSSHEVAVGILRRVGFERYFDLVVTSASTGIRKPDPGIFRYALYKSNTKPEEALIVGDSERHDIRGGKNAGMQTVLVNRKHPIDDSIADYGFKTLAQATPTLQSA